MEITKIWGQDKCSITWGTQKWRGAAPSFNIRAEVNIKVVRGEGM